MKKIPKKLENYVREWQKCKNDFEYFVKNYIMIDLPGKTVTLNPYKEQLRLIKFIQDKKHVIVLKSRQIGISTIVQAYLVYLSVFYKNVSIGVISKDATEATQFAKVCISMIDYLPKWMRPKYKKKTEQSFILNNGSKLAVSAILPSNPGKTFRGRSLTVLVLDEAAHCQYIKEAWIGMAPALGTNQKHARENNIPYATIVLSTPNKTVGIGKWFYDHYKSALEGGGIFHPIQIHWKNIEELGNEWYEEQCKLLKYDQKAIDQELNLKFLPGDDAFIPASIASILQENEIKPKHIIYPVPGYPNCEGWIFEEPILSRYYLIGIDTASEYGNDKSAIEVFDYETGEQVFEFQGKLPITEFKKCVISVAKMYNGLVIIENNSYASQLVEELSLLGDINLYFEKKGENKIQYGLTTTVKTRPLLLDALYSYVCEFPHLIKSSRLKLELIGLTIKKNKIQADEGENDDLAMATAMCFYVRKYDPPLNVIFKEKPELSSEFETIISYNFDINDNNIYKEVPISEQNLKILEFTNKIINSGISNPHWIDTLERNNFIQVPKKFKI